MSLILYVSRFDTMSKDREGSRSKEAKARRELLKDVIT